jgi:hypothetical protein
MARLLGLAIVDEYSDVCDGPGCHARGLDAVVTSVQVGETHFVLTATDRENSVNEACLRLVVKTVAASRGMVIGLYSDSSDRGTGRKPRNNAEIGKQILKSAVDTMVPTVASTCSERS